MSLIGSLDDLGLGDILQIINLSQKSGVLIVIGDQGEGRIVFRDGLVRAAVRKEDPHGLRDLVVASGAVPADVYDAALEAHRTANGSDQGVGEEEVDLAKLLVDQQLVSEEQLASLNRESVERAVIAMFSWRRGEFSFDVRSESEPGDPELLLGTGISAQFLAMEGARQQDELGQAAGSQLEFGTQESDEDASHDALLESTEAVDLVVERAVRAAEEDAVDDVSLTDDVPLIDAEPVVAASLEAAAPEPASDSVVEAQREDSLAFEDSDRADNVLPAVATVADVSAPVFEAAGAYAPGGALHSEASTVRPPLVVIDPELRVLEWTKRVLKSEFPHVHIFQQSNLGLVRIRQYLSRAEMPLVLISPETSGEPAAGIRDAADFVRRLKQQAPRMGILWLCETGPHAAGPADGSVYRPRLELLRDARAAHQRDGLAEVLRHDVLEGLSKLARAGAGDNAALDPPSGVALRRLREATDDLSAASARGEVLPRVIEFARQSLSRVAMFLIRDGQAEGMAQSGLSSCGGPDTDSFCEISLAVAGCRPFEEVLERRASVCGPPSDQDGGLGDLLTGAGRERPLEVYVAPIESSGQIVALLYADQLPEQREIGDTSALEVVLSHAGLTLDRAVLQRALHDAPGESAASTEGSID